MELFSSIQPILIKQLNSNLATVIIVIIYHHYFSVSLTIILICNLLKTDIHETITTIYK
jgi:ACT domain-containing protein